MAGISTSISMTDRISGALNRITEALYSTTAAFGTVDAASEAAFNTTAVNSIAEELYSYEQRVQELESELSGANNRLVEMEEQTRQNTIAAGSMESAFKKIAGVVATIGIGTMIQEEVSQAIDYASDLVEVQNVVDTVFGANSAIDEWAQSTLNAVGLNELSAKQYAGTMGAMLSSSGVAQEQVESMSMSIAELAGDMASFYNLQTDEAFEKIRSGISGETEPLKALGIDMSVANLEAYALAEGIKTSYSEMDQASRIALRYSYLMEATANAQGDFTRTSDSFANQTKLLQENWKAFTGEIAKYALPVLAQTMQRLNALVSSLSGYVPIFVAVGSTVWDILSGILDMISTIGGFVADNWSIIGPIVYGIVGALAVYATYLGMVKGAELASAAAKGAMAVAHGIQAAAIWATTSATWAETTAQLGLNSAMYACPIVWIIIAIIALIAILYAVCEAVAQLTGVANSGFGVICGGVNVVIQFFKNLGLMVANIALGIGSAIGALGTNIMTAFHNAICSVQSWWYDLLSTALTVVAGICEALNKLPFVEFDYSGITAKADEYAAKSAEAAGHKEDYTSVGDAFDKGMSTFDTFEDGWVSDAFDAGASWGDGVANDVSSFVDGLFGNDATSALTDGITAGLDGAYKQNDMTSLAGSAAETAGNTADIADSIDVSNENLEYLRDIAERDTINRFTTAEIKVEMTNNNNVSSDTDLDGMITKLNDGVKEAMESAAEGVHE